MLCVDLGALSAEDAARRLSGRSGFAWLDSALAHPTLGRWSYVTADPFAVFRVEEGVATLDGERLDGPPLAALAGVLSRFEAPDGSDLPPFAGGAVGFLSYEFGRCLERLPVPSRRQDGVPQALFGLHDVVLAFDGLTGRACLVSSGHPATGSEGRARRARERAEAVLAALAGPQRREGPDVPPPEFSSSMTRQAFEAAVARTIRYVLDGDVFQANIARRIAAAVGPDFDAFSFYRRLRRVNPAPFAAYLDWGDLRIASSSPERLVRVDGGRVEARPIKGTVSRSTVPADDATAAARLLASEKDRAENVMIVDLMRSDLSRVCRPWSVTVPVLAGLESYETVHHLVSVVRGELQEGLAATDVLAATFPGGSITGAPKVRAMEIIAELEGIERGVYCGSIGWLGFDGSADVNIAIRTVTIVDGEAVLHAGGGITALSDPESEYDETALKAARILEAFGAGAG
jgi:para-aminobenzoate synthetase component 1